VCNVSIVLLATKGLFLGLPAARKTTDPTSTSDSNRVVDFVINCLPSANFRCCAKLRFDHSQTFNEGAQTAFILLSTFLDLRPVSAANDLQTSINGRLEIRMSKTKTPI
jgi:hypothetical protein